MSAVTEERRLNTQEPERYVYIRETSALGRLVQRVRAAETVALDTEADSLHSYFEKVCLVQLSLGGEHYLVDPLAGLDLSGFLEIMADKPLILHGADYDLRMLRASMGFRPRREVFDTMLAAQLLGMEQIGLAVLIERYFGMRIGKEGQKSDWSRRPLSEQQLAYAVNDTRFLEPLAECLRGELSERGRIEWHRQSCRGMVEATGRDRSRDRENAWRFKGANRLTRAQLAYLRELWRWREEHARSVNVPPFKILSNQPMLDLVCWAESHRGVPLGQGPKLPRNLRGSLLRTLEEAITRVSRMDPAQWPEFGKRERGDGLPVECRMRFEALRDECARIAKALEIAASTLAPRAALQAVARSWPRNVDETMATSGLLRWQAELVQGVLDTLQGEIRINK